MDSSLTGYSRVNANERRLTRLAQEKGTSLTYRLTSANNCSNSSSAVSTRRALLHGLWGGYGNVSSVEQQAAVGKESGRTAHVERWNLRDCVI
jgi:hypothetical protein